MYQLSDVPPLTESILIVLSVVLIKSLLSTHWQDNTMAYFRFYCQRLADKVNKPSNSRYQLQISGLVAVVITLLPILLIVGLFEAFIAIEWLWQALLLFIALGDLSVPRQAKSIVIACQQQDKIGAKTLLAPLVLRDTTNLSVMGIYKATIEMHLLRNLHELFAPSVWFLILGPVGALGYRLLLEMHYSWNVKRERFVAFGHVATLACQLIIWLPTRLYYGLYLLSISAKNVGLYWRLTRSNFFSLNSNLVLTLHALVLNVQLGGVAIYDQQKLRRMSFNDQSRQPDAGDTLSSLRNIKNVNRFSAALLLFTALTTAVITYLSS